MMRKNRKRHLRWASAPVRDRYRLVQTRKPAPVGPGKAA